MYIYTYTYIFVYTSTYKQMVDAQDAANGCSTHTYLGCCNGAWVRMPFESHAPTKRVVGLLVYTHTYIHTYVGCCNGAAVQVLWNLILQDIHIQFLHIIYICSQAYTFRTLHRRSGAFTSHISSSNIYISNFYVYIFTYVRTHTYVGRCNGAAVRVHLKSHPPINRVAGLLT